MQLTLRNIQYHPNSDNIAFCMEHPLGTLLRPGSQAKVAARAPEGLAWGDAEALAEAQSIVDAEFPGKGFVVALPDPPPAPPAPDAGQQPS